MRISEIEAIPLRAPLPKDYPHPLASYVSEGFVILRVQTDQGLTGLGEPSPYGASIPQTIEAIETYLKPLVLGRDPFEVQSLTKLQAPEAGSRPGSVPMECAIAGLSQALWDIVGKALDQPVYRLLDPQSSGAVSVAAYASGGMTYEWEDDEILIEEAVRCRDEGYSGWKLRPPLPERASHQFRSQNPPRVDVNRFIKLLYRIRESTGTTMKLMADAGCRMTLEEAVRVAHTMKELDFLFFEEPLPRNPTLYRELRRAVDVPIAGGETLVAREEFASWVEADAYDVLQPDGNLAGITEALAVGKLAEEAGLNVVMHNWANDISVATNIHLTAAIPGASLVEHNITLNPLRGLLVDTPLTPENGRFELSDRPGLGITLREGVLEHYRMK